MMNHYRNIIIAPIITEKTTSLKENGSYVFKASPKANKIEIRQAIEKIFNVKVKEVRTMNVKPKKKRVGKYTGMTSKYKKAIVRLAEGYEINLD